MMIVFHIGFDLAYFYDFPFVVGEGAWHFLARTCQITFLLLVGICFVISWERAKPKIKCNSELFYKYLLRGLIIIGCGMVMTIATAIIIPDDYIIFGILHMIGVSVILLPFFRRFREFNVIIGFFIMTIGIAISKFALYLNQTDNFLRPLIDSKLLLPFGMYPYELTSVDFFPLLPWFGIILFGIAIGDMFYIRSKRKPVPTNKFWRIASWPGKHALIIYMIHQPVILLMLKIIIKQ